MEQLIDLCFKKYESLYMLEPFKDIASASQEIYLLMTQIRKVQRSNELAARCRGYNRYEHEGDKDSIVLPLQNYLKTDNAIEIIN